MRNVRSQRGAALILTVIVIMVLSVLGMAMVSFTTTEERTATSYRDGLQARALAYAGVNVVQEMFRDPVNRQLVPKHSTTASDCSANPTLADYCGSTESAVETSLNAKGIWRAARQNLTPARYTGINNHFFAGPFRDAWGQTFGGTYSASNDKYDLKFNCTNPSSGAVVASSACWLDSKVNALIASSGDYNLNTGKITDISFYAPPEEGENQYGITTVRVTAVKFDNFGNVAARETIEAVIGDSTPTPAVLGNGDTILSNQAGSLCGNGCEQIWVNGNFTGGSNVSGGTNPIVNASGTVDQAGGQWAGGKSKIKAPEINPWDTAYKPKTDNLNLYFLATARQLDSIWTDGNTANDNPAKSCGNDGLSTCQDYNLEFAADGTVKAPRKSAADCGGLAACQPYMYKWNGVDWTQCATGTTLDCTSVGGPKFTVTPANDIDVNGAADTTADEPFNKDRVPATVFTIDTKADGATVLVDGIFNKSGSMNATMSIIAVGSIKFHGSSTWYPAMTSYVMWISGRDLWSHSNCCAPSNTCVTNLSNNSMGIIAVHEQILMESQNAMAGIVVAENAVNLDTSGYGYDSNQYAINHIKGDHAYDCDGPKWPWTMPTVPSILSIKSVPD